MKPSIRLLYLDDAAHDRALVADVLHQHGDFTLTLAASRAEFDACLNAGGFDLVLSDFNILGFDGLQVLEAVKAKYPALPVVIITGTGSEKVAVEAMKRGASDYVLKTLHEIRRLPHTIEAAISQAHLRAEKAHAERALLANAIELERSNRSLQLLYRIAGILAAPPLSQTALIGILEDIHQLIGVSDARICVGCDALGGGSRLASWCREPGGIQGVHPLGCALCEVQGDSTTTTTATALPGERGEGGEIHKIPLVDQAETLGILWLRLPPGRCLASWELQLLGTIGHHFGTAIAAARRHEASHQLAVLEERSVIARELHDSLAQSLWYLRIQVVRLELELSHTAGHAATPLSGANAVVEEIREGLDGAYWQLRQLLSTYRLRIDNRGFDSALALAAQEFMRRYGLKVVLNNRLHGVLFTATEEIHIVHIVREALGNVERHAKASNVWVQLEVEADDHIRIRVDDDGQGLHPDGEPGNESDHCGMAFMRERARCLGGEVAWHRLSPHGTRVELRFAATRIGGLRSSTGVDE